MKQKRIVAKVNVELPWLECGLDIWTKRVARYAELWSTRADERRDAAYWHGERATASVFAAAFAETGVDVLCEYNCERIEQGSAARRGRTDFWCSAGSPHGAIFEAKQIWPAGPNVVAAQLEKAFAAAKTQLNSEHDVDSDTGVFSVVFAAPRIRWSYAVDDPAAPFIDSVITMAEGGILRSATAYAWCFPNVARNLRGVWAEEYTFPGVLAVVRKEVSTATA